MVSVGERYSASLSPLRHFQLPEVVGWVGLGSWHSRAQEVLWTLSNAFVEKGLDVWASSWQPSSRCTDRRLGKADTATASEHNCALDRNRFRHHCAGLGAEVSRRYLSFGWLSSSFISLWTYQALSDSSRKNALTGIVSPPKRRHVICQFTAVVGFNVLSLVLRLRNPSVRLGCVSNNFSKPRMCLLFSSASVAGNVHESAPSPRQRRNTLSCPSFW